MSDMSACIARNARECPFILTLHSLGERGSGRVFFFFYNRGHGNASTQPTNRVSLVTQPGILPTELCRASCAHGGVVQDTHDDII